MGNVKLYTFKKCLNVFRVGELKKDAKKRNGIVKGLRQCPKDKCGSVVFYN